MKLGNLTILCFSFLLLIILGNIDIFACQCSAKPTVLEAFEDAELVVIAKVVSIEMTEEAKDVDIEAESKKAGYDVSYRYVKSTKAVVEKIYKGDLFNYELKFIQGGGAECRWTFGKNSVNKKYLFYLGNPRYYVEACGRSQSINDYQSDDLKYLNNIDKVKGKTRISGTYNCWWTGCPKSFANLKVKIIGKNKVFLTKTDEHGIYEIYDLPPGKYFLEPEPPKGWKINQSMLKLSPAFKNLDYLFYVEKPDFSKRVPINLEDKKHTGIDFFFDINTAIRGKVLSPQGKPMSGVCIRAVSIEHKEGEYRGQSDCTDKRGIFLIQEVPQGKYILVVNPDGKLSGSQPFGRLFYPNGIEHNQAKVISVEAGQYLNNFVIHIPKLEKVVTIQGRWEYSDGTPVANRLVEFEIDDKNEKVNEKERAQTDKNGVFSFQVLKGYKGHLYGKIYSYIGKYKNCPQIEKIIIENSKETSGMDIQTREIAIDTNRSLFDVKLKYDFPSCEKAKN